MKDMTPLQRKKGAALVLARICEAYGRMLLLEGLFQVGSWWGITQWQDPRRSQLLLVARLCRGSHSWPFVMPQTV